MPTEVESVKTHVKGCGVGVRADAEVIPEAQ